MKNVEDAKDDGYANAYGHGNDKQSPAGDASLSVQASSYAHDNEATTTGEGVVDASHSFDVATAAIALAKHRRDALQTLGKADKPMLTGCRIRVQFRNVRFSANEVGRSDDHTCEGTYVGFAKHGLHSFGLGDNWHTIDLGPERGGARPMQLSKLSGWSLLDGGEPVANPLRLSKYAALVKCSVSEGTKLLRKFVHHCYGKTVVRQHDSGYGKEVQTFETAGSGPNRRVSVDLHKCQVTDLCCSQFASILSLCRSVVSIRLDYNNIGDGGAVSLASALPCCPQIEQIHLALNEIGDVGASSLATVLPELPTLHTLNLRSNDISSTGVEAFALRLADNKDTDVNNTSAHKRPLTELR